MIQFLKKDIILKEDTDRNYAATTDASNASAAQIVNKTKSEHSDANSVTIPGSEIDGDTSTQTTTVDVNNTPEGLRTAEKMARTLKSQNIDANFKVNLNNGVERSGKLVEGITFTKDELSHFLRNI